MRYWPSAKSVHPSPLFLFAASSEIQNKVLQNRWAIKCVSTTFWQYLLFYNCQQLHSIGFLHISSAMFYCDDDIQQWLHSLLSCARHWQEQTHQHNQALKWNRVLRTEDWVIYFLGQQTRYALARLVNGNTYMIVTIQRFDVRIDN